MEKFDVYEKGHRTIFKSKTHSNISITLSALDNYALIDVVTRVGYRTNMHVRYYPRRSFTDELDRLLSLGIGHARTTN